jgi:hypothetical protein
MYAGLGGNSLLNISGRQILLSAAIMRFILLISNKSIATIELMERII